MSTQRRFLAYCDKLFTPSESFIPRGYSAFSKLKPVYIGHELKGPVPEGAEVIELGPLHGAGGVPVAREVAAAARIVDVGKDRLDVSDRVRTRIEGPPAVVAALEAHRGLVAEETLTVDLELVDSGAADPRKDPADDAMKTVAVTVAKADA